MILEPGDFSQMLALMTNIRQVTFFSVAVSLLLLFVIMGYNCMHPKDL